MHDIAFIRQNPEAFDAGLAKRGHSPASHIVLEHDRNRRRLTTSIDEARAEKKRLSAFFGQLASLGQGHTPEAMGFKQGSIEQANIISELEKELAQVGDLRELLLTLPNIPADDVPEGMDETGNREIAIWGTPRHFSFTPKEHADLGPPLGLDFETGAAIAGARFTFLRGGIARLHRALGQFMLDTQTSQAGYIECNPPLLVKDEALIGTGQLPKFADDLYPVTSEYTRLNQANEALGDLNRQLGKENEFNAKQAEKLRSFMDGQLAFGPLHHELSAIFGEYAQNFEEKRKTFTEFVERFRPMEARLAELKAQSLDYGFWLIPTAEVSLTNAVRDKILDDAQLPMRLTALTPCFRSEAGAAGRDTRGFIRQHQFEKVELVAIVRPEDSEAEHEKLTAAAEAILQALELPYRKMLLCAGDMGAGARKTYDLEVWLPGQGAYREISSCSNFGDYQARRMDARYRPEGEKKARFVHTLNGSGLAVGRTLVAVLENYQQADGTVTIPQVLAPYMGGIAKLEPL